MSRKGENIHKRKDGRWEGRYIKEYDLTGKAKYGSVYAKTYSDVKRKLAEKNNFVNKNALTSKNDNLSFEEALNLWLENNKIKLKVQTYTKYKRLIETHIVPEVGCVKISKINTSFINRYIYEKSKNGRLDKKGGLSASYIKTISFIIASTMKFANSEGLCNSMIYEIAKPSSKHKEIEVLTNMEQSVLEKYLFDFHEDKKIGVFLSLHAGLRIGEVCGLMWRDIDFNAKTIHVRHTVIRIENVDEKEKNFKKTRLILGEVKTMSSNRIIPISEKLYSILFKIKKSPDKFVIEGTSYPYTDPRSYQYTFHKYLKESGIRNINYHALRHTFATRCVESGMDIKSLSEILGHANVNITLNTYVHSSIELKRIQLETMVSFCGQECGHKNLSVL